MTPELFKKLAGSNFNRIPVLREILADLETPLSAYMKLADTPYSYLFESVQGGEKWGRYSIIGLSSHTILRVSCNELIVEQDGRITQRQQTGDPLQDIEEFMRLYRVPVIAGLPKFTGGLVGFFGYDTVRYIEPRLACQRGDPLQTPDILLMVSDQLVVFDNLSGKLYIIVHANTDEPDAWNRANAELDRITQKLAGHAIRQPAVNKRNVHENDFVSGFTQEKFEAAVEKIKRYIVEGDVMQVVLSQRLTIPFAAPPINLYRALRCLN